MKHLREEGEVVDVGVANVLMLLSRGGGEDGAAGQEQQHQHGLSSRVFECKTCNRQFPSFQALGGHRASHKKPRVAAPGDQSSPMKPRVHECSICGLEFAIGQALGGHMRRHRVAAVEDVAVRGDHHHHHDHRHVEERTEKRRDDLGLSLDLNMPPMDSEVAVAADVDRLLTFRLGLPAAIDCLQ